MFLCAIRENVIAQVFSNLRKNNSARKYLQNECDILTTRILLIFTMISDLKLIISVIIAVKHTNAIHWYNAFPYLPIPHPICFSCSSFDILYQRSPLVVSNFCIFSKIRRARMKSRVVVGLLQLMPKDCT